MRKFMKRLSAARSSKKLQRKGNDKAHVVVKPVISPDAGVEDMPYIPPKASLEGLPLEIQSAVLLNIRDIASLENLIHASPTCHSAYLSQRHAILNRVLFNSIPPDVLYDAISAITSSKTLTSDLEDRVVRVKAFLSEYKQNRDSWASPEHLDWASASRLARLQNQVQHATEDLCQTAISSYPFTGIQAEHYEPLSSDESRRFYRAFYRFDLFCTLFRNWKTPLDEADLSDGSLQDEGSTYELDPMEMSLRFFSLFTPWEVEELACVRDYLYNYYRRMLREYEPDLRERKPEYDISEDGPYLEENIEYFMALSLPFYRRMEMSSPERQMRYLDHGLQIGPPFLSSALSKPSEAAIYQEMIVEDPVKLHFGGDNVRSGPNVMWLWASYNGIDLGYFWPVHEPLRKWGYVFWDQKRLEKWDVPNEDYEAWSERRRAQIRARLRKASAEQS